MLTAEMLYTAWYQAYQEKIAEPLGKAGIPALKYPTWKQMQGQQHINSNVRREIALYERMAELANAQMGLWATSGSVEE